MALILRESDVQDLIEMEDVIGAVEAAMRELGEGDAENEPRRRAFAPGGLLNVMFASYPGGNCTGLKAYTVADGHVRFLVVLFGTDGSMLAMIEADFMGEGAWLARLGHRGAGRDGLAGRHPGAGPLPRPRDQGAARVQPQR